MATSPVPMFAPDGTVRQVPSDQVDAATKAGGEIAHQMKAPDGSVRYVPHSQFGAALKAGGVPVDAARPSLQQNLSALRSAVSQYPQQEQAESMAKYTNTYGDMLGRFVGNLASTLPDTSYERGKAQGKSAIQQQLENLNAQNPINAAKTVGGIAQQALNGDIAGALGRATGIGGQVALVKKIGESVRPAPAPVTPQAAGELVTNAVNPATNEMAAMRSQVAQHMPAIIEESRLTNTPITGQRALAQVAQSAAERAHTQFRSIVDPIANVEVEAPNGFKGGTSPRVGSQGQNTPFTTIGEMLGRLKEINATLNPKYAKGGQTAQMAINAESVADLTREAAAIRSRVYGEIGNRTNLPPEQVAQLYQRAGSLSDFADSIRYYSDEAQHAVNAATNKPLTVNPFSKDAGRTFVLDPAANSVINALRGIPADDAIKKAFNQ